MTPRFPPLLTAQDRVARRRSQDRARCGGAVIATSSASKGSTASVNGRATPWPGKSGESTTTVSGYSPARAAGRRGGWTVNWTTASSPGARSTAHGRSTHQSAAAKSVTHREKVAICGPPLVMNTGSALARARLHLEVRPAQAGDDEGGVRRGGRHGAGRAGRAGAQVRRLAVNLGCQGRGSGQGIVRPTAILARRVTLDPSARGAADSIRIERQMVRQVEVRIAHARSIVTEGRAVKQAGASEDASPQPCHPNRRRRTTWRGHGRRWNMGNPAPHAYPSLRARDLLAWQRARPGRWRASTGGARRGESRCRRVSNGAPRRRDDTAAAWRFR